MIAPYVSTVESFIVAVAAALLDYEDTERTEECEIRKPRGSTNLS